MRWAQCPDGHSSSSAARSARHRAALVPRRPRSPLGDLACRGACAAGCTWVRVAHREGEAQTMRRFHFSQATSRRRSAVAGATAALLAVLLVVGTAAAGIKYVPDVTDVPANFDITLR